MNKAFRKAGIEEKYFDTGEVKLNYVAGPRNGIPIVFIPAQGATWEEYQLLLPKLAHRFQVFAVSLRGHGNSSWTPSRYTLNILGEDMTTFLREVVGKPAVVGGNSSGGVLAVWLAANAPEHVQAIICEDPPLFRCEWPAIKTLVAYNIFLGWAKMAVAGGGGFPKYFTESIAQLADIGKGVLEIKLPPKAIVEFISTLIALQLAIRPGSAVDLKFLPLPARIAMKGLSQYDGNFSRAFVDGTMGEGFDHATALAKVTQPILFLHATWFMIGERIMGALTDDDVQHVKSLVKGSFKYVRINCGHYIAVEKPDEECKEIMSFIDEYLK